MQPILKILFYNSDHYILNVLILALYFIMSYVAFKMLFPSCCNKVKKRISNDDERNHRPLCAIVSGCSSGIGLATLKAIYKDTDLELIGLDVVEVDGKEIFQEFITDDASSEGLDRRFTSFKCDVTKDKDLKKVYDFLIGNDYAVDVLICCAGITRTGPLMELSANQIQKVMDINVMGVHRCVKAFFGCMQQGSIVVPILSEIAYAMQSSAFNAAYSMSKFALQAYVIALRQELSLVGVQVKGVYPGAIATKLSMNHTTDMTIQHIENNKTLFKNPLLQFIDASKSYIHKMAKEPKYVANEIVKICLYENPNKNILVNVSIMMKILKYLPEAVMDYGAGIMLRGADEWNDDECVRGTHPSIINKKLDIRGGWGDRRLIFDEIYTKLHSREDGFRISNVDLRETLPARFFQQ